jgi:hypothetical protein
MISVMFSFRPNVTLERQKAVLDNISHWREVYRASRLRPNAKHPEVLRMCYAYVEDPTNVGMTVRRLESMPEVESASVPAERQLV